MPFPRIPRRIGLLAALLPLLAPGCTDRDATPPVPPRPTFDGEASHARMVTFLEQIRRRSAEENPLHRRRPGEALPGPRRRADGRRGSGRAGSRPLRAGERRASPRPDARRDPPVRGGVRTPSRGRRSIDAGARPSHHAAAGAGLAAAGRERELRDGESRGRLPGSHQRGRPASAHRGLHARDPLPAGGAGRDRAGRSPAADGDLAPQRGAPDAGHVAGRRASRCSPAGVRVRVVVQDAAVPQRRPLGRAGRVQPGGRRRHRGLRRGRSPRRVHHHVGSGRTGALLPQPGGRHVRESIVRREPGRDPVRPERESRGLRQRRRRRRADPAGRVAGATPGGTRTPSSATTAARSWT